MVIGHTKDQNTQNPMRVNNVKSFKALCKNTFKMCICRETETSIIQYQRGRYVVSHGKRYNDQWTEDIELEVIRQVPCPSHTLFKGEMRPKIWGHTDSKICQLKCSLWIDSQALLPLRFQQDYWCTTGSTSNLFCMLPFHSSTQAQEAHSSKTESRPQKWTWPFHKQESICNKYKWISNSSESGSKTHKSLCL